MLLITINAIIYFLTRRIFMSMWYKIILFKSTNIMIIIIIVSGVNANIIIIFIIPGVNDN